MIKPKDVRKTPEKQILLENQVPATRDLLRSPDLLPPTPPQPKRMKLEKNPVKTKLMKLQPKDLVKKMTTEEDICLKNKFVPETQTFETVPLKNILPKEQGKIKNN